MPAKLASVPNTRSSSVGWPHDSWIWSATCVESRMTSISPDGHCGASSRATASSAVSCAWSARPSARTASNPPVTDLPAERVRVAALLHLAVVDRRGLDAAAGLDDLLLDPGAGEWRRRSSARARRPCCPRGSRRPARGPWRHRLPSARAACRRGRPRTGPPGTACGRCRSQAGVSSSSIGSRWATAEARAISRASRVMRSASSRSRRELELKPQAPSSRTRTPNPALEFEVAASRAPFLTVSPSVSRSTTRTSA